MRSWQHGRRIGVAIAVISTAGVLACKEIPGRYAAVLQPGFLTSREQRFTHFFGECEPAGYGYLKRVLAAYSRLEHDSRKRPIIRYADYNRKSEYLFEPTRFETDSSIIVGIGLTESDVEEREIRRASAGRDGTWRFEVVTNFDSLTRIDVALAERPVRDVRLRLYRDEKDESPIWTSTKSVTDGEAGSDASEWRLQFVADPPLSDFRARLVEPALVKIDGTAAVHGVTVYGIVANIGGYRIIHRRGACFTAVAAVEDGQQRSWAPLIRELQRSDD